MSSTAPTELVRYAAARRALAEAHRVDEVKNIRDKAVAMQVYAKQARDGELIGLAAEMRKRAERRLGELIEDERKAGKLAKGARGNPRGRGAKIVQVANGPTQTLEQRGVDKHLADRARKMAALPEANFESVVAKAVKIAVAAVENNAAVIREARRERHEAKQATRQARERELAGKQLALPNKKYGVILADPEWKFGYWSEKAMTRAADNHYPTSVTAEIAARDVPSIAADDCVLFLWATVPMLLDALAVMKAWGFEYKSQAVWDKEIAGTGYWFRNQHELLLVGTRGDVPCPAEGDQWLSVIRERKTEHSVKPERAYQLIESYFPTVPKIELNARRARAGWDAWGFEAPSVVDACA